MSLVDFCSLSYESLIQNALHLYLYGEEYFVFSLESHFRALGLRLWSLTHMEFGWYRVRGKDLVSLSCL